MAEHFPGREVLRIQLQSLPQVNDAFLQLAFTTEQRHAQVMIR